METITMTETAPGRYEGAMTTAEIKHPDGSTVGVIYLGPVRHHVGGISARQWIAVRRDGVASLGHAGWSTLFDDPPSAHVVRGAKIPAAVESVIAGIARGAP